ncbi:MBL fold metallo-hydrolase [Halodesulfurarchaeum sp.]|uniref:MBL fold metallo-hydrolase n=1 Tax=Halodesulfurarchaeum sp. TaxID=1980530 RepID=UPI001BBB3F27|nr:MBL fold metallo-hydrolase [Halodesulfurarchaeum sp.]
MELTFLGTGSAMPTAKRVQSGLLLTEGDRRLLVDAGSGTLHRLAGTETGYEGVETVLLTHLHLDHVADLLPLYKARWLAGADTLTVVGPPGTESLLDGLLEVHDYLDGRLSLAVREIEAGSTEVAGFDVTAMPNRHSMDGFAYRFEDRLTLSGDTQEFAGLIDFAAVGSVLVHDCSFPDGVDEDAHTTPTKLRRVLAGAPIDRVYLTHLYPHTRGEHESMIEIIEAEFDGEVQIATDGLTVPVSLIN